MKTCTFRAERRLFVHSEKGLILSHQGKKSANFGEFPLMKPLFRLTLSPASFVHCHTLLHCSLFNLFGISRLKPTMFDVWCVYINVIVISRFESILPKHLQLVFVSTANYFVQTLGIQKTEEGGDSTPFSPPAQKKVSLKLFLCLFFLFTAFETSFSSLTLFLGERERKIAFRFFALLQAFVHTPAITFFSLWLAPIHHLRTLRDEPTPFERARVCVRC